MADNDGQALARHAAEVDAEPPAGGTPSETDTPAPALGSLAGRQVPRLPSAPSAAATTRGGGKRSHSSYTELERVSALVVVAAVGVREASRAVGVPDRTLRGWAADAGGLAGLTLAIRHAVGVTQYALALRVADEIARRLGDYAPEELVTLYKALTLGAAGLGGVPGAEVGEAGAGAAARASITVQILGPDGVETIPIDAAALARSRASSVAPGADAAAAAVDVGRA